MLRALQLSDSGRAGAVSMSNGCTMSAGNFFKQEQVNKHEHENRNHLRLNYCSISRHASGRLVPTRREPAPTPCVGHVISGSNVKVDVIDSEDIGDVLLGIDVMLLIKYL